MYYALCRRVSAPSSGVPCQDNLFANCDSTFPKLGCILSEVYPSLISLGAVQPFKHDLFRAPAHNSHFSYVRIALGLAISLCVCRCDLLALYIPRFFPIPLDPSLIAVPPAKTVPANLYNGPTFFPCSPPSCFQEAL